MIGQTLRLDKRRAIDNRFDLRTKALPAPGRRWCGETEIEFRFPEIQP